MSESTSATIDASLGEPAREPATARLRGPWTVETLARNGEVLHRHRVASLPIRMGRAYDNDFIAPTWSI